tara:strand:- start:58 stop:495 length:438 start_codon:yes stop_codon:yes gene_type:complete
MLNFLEDNERDVYKRYLKDIWIMSDEQIEDTDNFIQWVFPLNERSIEVPKSPILTNEEIISIKKSETAQKNIKKSTEWFLEFLTRNSYWICQTNHNHLRITRAIKSLRLIHSNEEAEKFKNSIMNLINGNEKKINLTTLEYWKNS